MTCSNRLLLWERKSGGGVVVELLATVLSKAVDQAVEAETMGAYS